MIGDMYGDFSRLTFAPEKRFSAVLLQQGRVMLDADANEHTAIFLHNLRRLIVDVIGRYGAPAGDGDSFFIVLDTSTPGSPMLNIQAGHYYVNGLLCELEEETNYYDQAEAFLDPELADDRLPEDGPYLVYLKVWERHITAAEDPSIREQALGDNGPDTAARSKVVWQVRATTEMPPGSGQTIAEWPEVTPDEARKRWGFWENEGRDTPMLRARARSDSADLLEPCLASPEARYRGLENQLYRVEVHAGLGLHAGAARFKWSRENGAVVFPIESLEGTGATVATLGRDAGLGLAPGDWVEVLDDRSVLRGERHPLVRVASVDPLERLVVLEEAPGGGVGRNPTLHPILRRWDHQEGPEASGYPRLDPDTGLLVIEEGTGDEDNWLKLEDGVEIQFQPGADYLPGDYWLIPARTAIEDVEWPPADGGPAARPPLGLEYAYAPLALVDAAGDVHDMRSTFGSLAKPVA